MLALACAPTTTCRAGYAADSTGHCWPQDAVGFEDALDDLPPCDRAEGDGRLDLEGGCADGACAGDPIEVFDAVFGPDRACFAASWDANWTYCDWPAGVQGLFLDADRSGEPDAGVASDRLRVYAPYEGQTWRGVGIDAPTACFLDTLGTPETLVLTDVAGALVPEELWWPATQVRAYDWEAGSGGDHADGRPDNLYLYGPL